MFIGLHRQSHRAGAMTDRDTPDAKIFCSTAITVFLASFTFSTEVETVLEKRNSYHHIFAFF
jgi:hypothetical protein